MIQATNAPMSDFDYSIVDLTAHRPWPMPSRPWLMTQSWHDLLFAHWQIDPTQLRALVPDAFELDLHQGIAWLGIVPFSMSNVGPRGVPNLPWVSSFPELNVRTYVRVGDRPGVFFFSLDAARLLAVQTARMLLNLPYHLANMSAERCGEEVRYESWRASGDVGFKASYAPIGAPLNPSPGTLAHFLTERYCLYHVDHRGRPYRLDIHHPPWPLQDARANIDINTMAAANGLSIAGPPAVLHFSRRQDIVAWAPVPLEARD